ncbi:hypothetical protein MKX01_011867 [Papaver californicum]|nr:hypothetical protein MKX01_011867 [Papaver californicum]
MFIIKFEKEGDKKFMLKKKISSINGYLVIMYHWDPTVDDIKLDWSHVKVEFEIWNQPQEFQTRSFAEKMGRMLGEFCSVDPPNGIAAKHKRVKVTTLMSVNTPWSELFK